MRNRAVQFLLNAPQIKLNIEQSVKNKGLHFSSFRKLDFINCNHQKWLNSESKFHSIELVKRTFKKIARNLRFQCVLSVHFICKMGWLRMSVIGKFAAFWQKPHLSWGCQAARCLEMLSIFHGIGMEKNEHSHSHTFTHSTVGVSFCSERKQTTSDSLCQHVQNCLLFGAFNFSIWFFWLKLSCRWHNKVRIEVEKQALTYMRWTNGIRSFFRLSFK